MNRALNFLAWLTYAAGVSLAITSGLEIATGSDPDPVVWLGLLAGTWAAALARVVARDARGLAHLDLRIQELEASAEDLDAANVTLLESAAAWRRAAIGWQRRAELAEAEHDVAMLHTELGETLCELRRLPDTRERA